MALTETLVHEDGNHIYLVAPVRPLTPSDEEVASYDFIDALRKRAPNEHLSWYGGHYVEADNPNGNGATWSAGELEIKSLTPMLMPITVMHDPRTAVGLIADTALRTPEKDKVPRAKIDTALALWAHRFPEVDEEAKFNYQQGTLMQSMECLAPNYDCGNCGMGYTKLPQGAEQANWCACLKGETAGVTPTRILRSVVFTGTGLIFGTRGGIGADPQAHLETFQQEVAEFHTRSHEASPRPRRKRTMNIEVDKAEYDELQKRPSREELAAANERAEKAERDLEAAETAKVAAETEKAELQKKVDSAEEAARQVTLRDERLEALGDGFVAALGEKTKARLTTQAGTLKDDEWASRLDELEELTGKKRDVKKDGTEPAETAGAAQTFSAEEVARFGGGAAPAPGEPKPNARRSVLAGLTSSK